MRFVRFAGDRDGTSLVGAVRHDGIADLAGVVPSQDDLLLGPPTSVPAGATIHPFADVRLLPPVVPASLRDFLGYEDHARAGARRRGGDLDPAWFEMPVYYKGNHRTILGPDEPLAYPTWTGWLDFELEVAAVVGRRVRSASPEEAAEAIFGYTIMNDWSARDLQLTEMALRLGPARSKDFATSLGPWLVTADEVDPASGLEMIARVDGEEWFRGSTASMHWSFAQMISWVSQGEDVLPGDVYGSGTAFGGCGLDQDRRIPHNCVVELEVAGLGVLRTPIV